MQRLPRRRGDGIGHGGELFDRGVHELARVGDRDCGRLLEQELNRRFDQRGGVLQHLAGVGHRAVAHELELRPHHGKISTNDRHRVPELGKFGGGMRREKVGPRSNLQRELGAGELAERIQHHVFPLGQHGADDEVSPRWLAELAERERPRPVEYCKRNAGRTVGPVLELADLNAAALRLAPLAEVDGASNGQINPVHPNR